MNQSSAQNQSIPAGPPGPVYDVANDSIRLDGSTAFENPSYATHEEVNRMRQVGYLKGAIIFYREGGAVCL